MKINVLILPLLVIAASCTKPVERTEVVGPEVIRAEIQSLENNYARWVNSKNVDSIMQYYADDAVSYDSNSKPLHGKDEIRESMKELSKGFPEGAGIKYTVMEVYPTSDGQQVVEIGHYRIDDPKGRNYGSGNYFSLFEKRDDKYLCIRDIQTPDSSN
ncbi:YybH family protein [Flavobacterium silvaticum]|uniref:Nuclear transport factor 2 family protein n=1 Tax=Flavobacterium silvaticum TaxID=1852020 RepID=A0A972FTK2_9FLAO|nr:nuclear transport factor 2 family protein [Flavobacterium silvaticum]NMH27757.1 nuclear transport factor 2 family protein [Flavobacterium silvaticum]